MSQKNAPITVKKVEATAQIPINPSLAEACDKGKIEEYETDYLDQMIEKI